MSSCMQLCTTTSTSQRRDQLSRFNPPDSPLVTAFRGPSQMLNRSFTESMPLELTLPPELLNNIFDHLHPVQWQCAGKEAARAKSDLHACTLVSRAWYPLSQEHLFRDVVFSFRCHLDAGEDAPKDVGLHGRWVRRMGSPLSPHKTLFTFVDFLRQCPALARSIRRLALHAHSSTVTRTRTVGEDVGKWVSQWQPQDRVDASTFSALLQCASRVQELHLSNVVVSRPTVIYTPPYRPVLQELHATLGDWHPSSVDLPALLRHFDTIQDLQLKGIDFPANTNDERLPAYVTESQTTVSSLTWQGRCSPPTGFTAALSRSLDLQAIKRLTLLAAEPSPELQELVEVTSPNLEELRLRIIPEPFEDPLSAPILTIDDCTELREITVGLNLPFDDLELLHDLTQRVSRFFAAARISRLGYDKLASIIFEIDFHGRPFSDESWLELVEPLSGDLDRALTYAVQQSDVKNVAFEWAHQRRNLGRAGMETVFKLFPALQASGALCYGEGRSDVWGSSASR